ncbi:class C sortase [Streptococcus canis]|uniref:class C sortase n=1 Tax=Streptococcus canis TaxID=1329 RepID=UPI0013886D9A|nr:class C sortase [Streptococcus canis]MDV6000318.1 class C sortase [Streptococcus canis]GFG42287.1 class C sortase [Streptococcus canis]
MSKSYRKAIGYLLMCLALLVPIFCFGQIVNQSLNKESKYHAYRETVKSVNLQIKTKKIDRYNQKLNQEQNIVDPFLGEKYHVNYGILDSQDAIYGYLAIPSLDLLEPVYLGADDRHLLLGLAHVDGTSLPSNELTQRSVIAGHRGYPSKVFFRYINRLKKGDLLYFNDGKETFAYRMIDSEIILPSEWEKLNPKKGQNLLTLISCDPIPLYNKRLLVNFERTEAISSQKRTRKEVNKPTNKDILLTSLKTTKSRVTKSIWLFKTIFISSTILLLFTIYRLIRYLFTKI